MSRRESVHPASSYLANESAHIEDECAEHDLHAFQAIRRMDELLRSLAAAGGLGAQIGAQLTAADHLGKLLNRRRRLPLPRLCV